MDNIKVGNRLKFKEFNDSWARKGNYCYLVFSTNKKKMEILEQHLFGLGFSMKIQSSLSTPNWNHASRKNFNIRVYPFTKRFCRIKDNLDKYGYYSNLYDIDMFDKMCFRYVLFEKYIKFEIK